MIYRSNLVVPDLSGSFRLREPALQISGHDIPSDPDYEPDCGFWSHDEAAILYHVASEFPGTWVDIGARFGWTTAHLAAAGAMVYAVDPQLQDGKRRGRFWDNCKVFIRATIPIAVCSGTSDVYYLQHGSRKITGCVIDGNHDAPAPLNDARGFLRIAAPRCVVMLHDFVGGPVRDAARFLIENGFRIKVYWTPNVVACLWRGDFEPPKHVHDPRIQKHADIVKEFGE